jgi:hypothetical protein
MSGHMFLGLSGEVQSILLKAGYDTVEKLAAASDIELLKLDRMGANRLNEVRRFLGRKEAKPPSVLMRIARAARYLRSHGYRVEKIE